MKRYGWTPEQINRLTPYQAMMFTCALAPEDFDEEGGPEMSPEEVDRYFGPREWTVPGDGVI